MCSNFAWRLASTSAIIFGFAIVGLAIKVAMIPLEEFIAPTWLRVITAYIALSIITVLGWMALRYSLNAYWRR